MKNSTPKPGNKDIDQIASNKEVSAKKHLTNSEVNDFVRQEDESETYSRDQVFLETLNYFQKDEIAAMTWMQSCAKRNFYNRFLELTPDDMHKRIAGEISRIEQKYNYPMAEADIYSLLKDFSYLIPSTQVMRGTGNPYILAPLANSFVIGNDTKSDSYGGILKTEEEQIQIMKRGGGVAHDLSHIRPKGAPVLNSALTSTGVVPFMARYSKASKEFTKEARIGPLRLSIDIRHPDVPDIIKEKFEDFKMPGNSVSFKITDDFIKIVQNSVSIRQSFPVDSAGSSFEKEKSAKDIWNKIMYAAWEGSEPVILFWDTLKRESISDCYADSGFASLTTDAAMGVLLSSNETCHRLALNLYPYVDNPFSADARFNFKLFKKHIASAVRIGDDIVDLNLEKIDKIIQKIQNDPESEAIKSTEHKLWLNIKEKIELSRRIGLGILGEADMLASLGLTYGSDEALAFMEEVHKTLAVEAFKASVVLAEERGSFPIYDFQKEIKNNFISRLKESDVVLYDRMKTTGRRNIGLLTISPTGTMSILARTSAGIEAIYAPYFKRRRKISLLPSETGKFQIDELGDAWEEYIVFHHKLKDWLTLKDINPDKLAKLPELEINDALTNSPFKDAAIDDISWNIQLKVNALVQKWTDQGLTNTLFVPETTDVKTMSEIYLAAHSSACKSISIYRKGSRDKTILKRAVKREETIPPRPLTLKADVIRFKNNTENWIAFVGLRDNKPYEIFTGLDDAELFPIPLSIKQGTIVKSKTESGDSIYDFEYTDRYGYKNKIGGLHHMFDPVFWNYARLISGILRYGMPLEHAVHLVSTLKLDFDFVHSWTKGVKRALSVYIEDETEAKGVCENCGSSNISFQEGCPKCRDCGFGQC